MTQEEEPFKTFGDYTERWWTVYMLLLDVIVQLYRDLQAAWRSLWDEQDVVHARGDEDRSLYAAA